MIYYMYTNITAYFQIMITVQKNELLLLLLFPHPVCFKIQVSRLISETKGPYKRFQAKLF